MRIKLALISAFFMSFYTYSNDLKSPSNASYIEFSCVQNGSENIIFEHGLSAQGNPSDTDSLLPYCNNLAQERGLSFISCEGESSTTTEISDGFLIATTTFKAMNTWNVCSATHVRNHAYKIANVISQNSPTCPPEDFPDYTVPIPDPNNPEQIMCQRPESVVTNDDDCPQLGDVSNFSFGGANQTMCFANSNNPDTTKTCNYTSDDSGMYNLPDLGAQEPIACNDGDSNNDNGEDNKPNPPDLDEDGCFTAQNGKYCAKDPDDVCDVETGIEGHTAYNCSEGCGKVTIADGSTGFYCTEENNNDGLPSLDCSDTEYAETNPDICAVDNNTDKDGDGQIDNSDVVQGLNELKQKSQEGNLKLNEISDGIKELGDKQGEGNKILAKMDGKIGDIVENTGVTAVNTGLIDLTLQEIDKTLTTPLTVGERGRFDIEAAEKELEEVETEYQTKFNSIKDEAANIISKLNAGGGSFDSCHDLISMNGVVHNRCTSQFSDEMSVISNGVLLLFTILAGFIVLRGATKND